MQAEFLRSDAHLKNKGERKFFSGQDLIPLLCFFGVPLYLYVNLFTFHNIPFLLVSDQTVFWEYAFRMSQGDHVYRDFFQFTPPGTDLLYLALLNLFGPSLWVVNFGVVLLGVGLFWVCFSVARRILSRNQALFASAIVLILLFGDWLGLIHG